MRAPEDTFPSKRVSLVEFASNPEYSVINEQEKVCDENHELLKGSKPVDILPPRRRKLLRLELGSTGSLQGILKNKIKKERSYSMPFIQKISTNKRSEDDKVFIDTMTMILSGLYCKTLVVLGMCFPVAEVLSAHVPSSFYETFYFYLYVGSMLFLIFTYVALIRERRKKKFMLPKKPDSPTTKEMKMKPPQPNSRYGSFYLRLGAAAFGVGSMIYACLEFGQYFELVSNVKCSNVLMAVTPGLRMVFIVLQLQFIFVNDNQKTLRNYRTVSRFGLMHMIATNLCVWLNILVQETKHEIITFYSPNTTSEDIYNNFEGNLLQASQQVTDHDDMLELTSNFLHNIVEIPTNDSSLTRLKRGLRRPQELYECRRANIMGSLVQNAAPFLFPCTIEYSLICAVILYALWKNLNGKNKKAKHSGGFANRVLKPVTSFTSQYFTVDCANSHKGLFASILVMVFTIISLIMFFALIKHKEYAKTAVFQVNLCELTLYVLGTLATILAMYKIKDLRYESNRHLELDNILLVMAQTGLYMYFMFSFIAGYFTKEIFRRPNISVTAIFGIIQSSMQTLFIIDAWWRRCTTTATMREKPARQLVTFLLLINIAMWAISHLENARADFHPIELKFYGVWAWTIITHLSMPLAVFYRFHSTVCLCEIWKCTYKMRLHNFFKENEVVTV